jgi:hypothetical protein
LQVNKLHFIGGLLCAGSLVYFITYELAIGPELRGLIWLVVASLAYRIGPVITGVTRRRDDTGPAR